MVSAGGQRDRETRLRTLVRGTRSITSGIAGECWRQRRWANTRIAICGEDGTRTRNPRLAKAVRYQLRHFPVRNLHHQIDRSRSAPRKVPAGRIDNT